MGRSNILKIPAGGAFAFTLYLCLLIILALTSREVFSASVKPSEANFYKNSKAVLIGINNYKNQPWNDYQLDYADDDAKSMAKLLVERFAFKKDNVVLLLDEKALKEISEDEYFKGFRKKPATLSNIKYVLGDLSDQQGSGREDRVLIFYAGHGYTLSLPTGGEMGFIIPLDSRGNNAASLYSSALAMSEFKNLSDLVAAKHVLFLIDACFSGLATGRYYAIPNTESDYIKKVSRLPVRQIITAGGKGEQVVESSEWGHSAFTFKLIEALEKGVADKDADGFTTGRELANYLRPVVTNVTKGLQTPQEGRFSGEGEFIFITGGSASLVVKSIPNGADVLIDGDKKGNTGAGQVLVRDLRSTAYKLIVRKFGYYDYEETISLQPGDEKTITAELVPKPASIMVMTAPEGAEVYLDAEFKGITGKLPLEVHNLSPGSHNLRIHREGYQDFAEVLLLKPDEKKEVFKTLSSRPTSIMVYAWPTGASVYINGELKGSSGDEPVVVGNLGSGQYTLRITKGGYKDHEEIISPEPGEKVEKYINLKVIPSMIVVTSVPAGARVYINDEYVGDTVLQRQLNPGIYKIVIEKEGYKRYEHKVQMGRGKQELVSAFLKESTSPGPPRSMARKAPREKPVIKKYRPPETMAESILMTWSNPSGAGIYIDGEFKGTAPATVGGLTPGQHEIVLKKAGYYEWMQRITLKQGKTYKLNAELMTETTTESPAAKPSVLQEAKLSLTSSPREADIYIDDKPINEHTPSTVKVAPGSHKITIKTGGYLDWVRYIALEPGEESELHARLSSITVSLKVVSDPEGGKVYVDDQDEGDETPVSLSSIEPGTHKVTVKKEGYHDWVQYVVLEPGGQQELSAKLQPLTAKLDISSEPSGALVFIDDAYMKRDTPATVADISAGSHKISLKKKGYADWVKYVSLEPEGIQELSANLQPLSTDLTITSEPDGAGIFIDDQPTDFKTPATIKNIQPGTHKVTLKKERYYDWIKYLELQPGETQELSNVALVEESPETGTIKLISKPAGGRIYIDGKFTNEITPATLSDLKPNIYFIAVKKEGYRGWAERIEVHSGKTTEQEADLGPVIINYQNARTILRDNISRSENVKAITTTCMNVTENQIYLCQNMRYLETRDTARGFKLVSGNAYWNANIPYDSIREVKILDPMFGDPNGIEIKGDFKILYRQEPRVYIDAGINKDLTDGRLYLPCKGKEECGLAKSALESLKRGR